MEEFGRIGPPAAPARCGRFLRGRLQLRKCNYRYFNSALRARGPMRPLAFALGRLAHRPLGRAHAATSAPRRPLGWPCDMATWRHGRPDTTGAGRTACQCGRLTRPTDTD